MILLAGSLSLLTSSVVVVVVVVVNHLAVLFIVLACCSCVLTVYYMFLLAVFPPKLFCSFALVPLIFTLSVTLVRLISFLNIYYELFF